MESPIMPYNEQAIRVLELMKEEARVRETPFLQAKEKATRSQRVVAAIEQLQRIYQAYQQ